MDQFSSESRVVVIVRWWLVWCGVSGAVRLKFV